MLMPLYFLKSSFSWAIIFPYLCKHSSWQTQRQNQNFLSLNQRVKFHHQQNILFLWYRLPKFDLSPCQKQVLSLMRKRTTWLKTAFKSDSFIVSRTAFWEEGCNLNHVGEHLDKYNNPPTVELQLLEGTFQQWPSLHIRRVLHDHFLFQNPKIFLPFYQSLVSLYTPLSPNNGHFSTVAPCLCSQGCRHREVGRNGRNETFSLKSVVH